MTVVHLSFDYPDKIDGKKTKAVKNLITSQSLTKNIVFSLNRTAQPMKRLEVIREEHGFTMFVYGFPFGLFLFHWMFVAYHRIYRILKEENITPDLIHAHKLTFEGIIAFFLAKRLKIPYVITVRGNTDLNVLFYKRLYHKFYSMVIANAQKLIFLAPWTVKPMQTYFGEIRTNKFEIIPNVVNLTVRNGTPPSKVNRFITVFHFKTYKLKNISRVIKAFERVFQNYPSYGLDIVGDGPNKDRILQDIRNTAFSENFALKGAMDNSQLSKIYGNYLGFILPSFPETFGLVFVEALSAGIPIIYTKNAAIDGYFNHFDVGISVNHRSVEEIAAAIEKVIEKNEEYKLNVERMIASGYLEQFSRRAVGEKYAQIVCTEQAYATT